MLQSMGLKESDMKREVGGGLGLEARVHPWQIHVDVCQSQYGVVE